MNQNPRTYTTKSGKTFTEAELMAMAEGLADGDTPTLNSPQSRRPADAHPAG